ncbi:MAG TPA: HTTM domain-containing protein [Kofleriaceae bacterium]|nr:HTTM domain-containing protein [Kofleriaceae bacterium]
MKTLWNRLLATSLRPRCLYGASILRVMAGCVILYQLLINYGQRGFLFGPDGVLSFDDFTALQRAVGSFSLYHLSTSRIWFELLYHASIAVAMAWALGWRTRLLSPVNYLLWMSLHNRFPQLWDGGDNLMQLVLIYALFAEVGAHFSFDASRRAANGQPNEPSGAWAIAHNAALLAIAFQVCLVYGVAGLTKVRGDVWQNGTALYYALRSPDYRLPGVSPLLYENGVLLTLLAYSTVAFQVAFPFLVFAHRHTRTLAVLVGISFHLAIGSVMGLVTFALFLIAADLTLIGDDEYRGLGRLARGAWQRVERRLPRRRGAAEAPDPGAAMS